MGAGGRSADFRARRVLRAERRMEAKARTRTAVGLAACVVALAALAWPGGASGAKWVVKGRGWGHGVGMSQYGAYGLAQHGRGYRKILHHYYRHTRIGHAGSNTIKVLLGSGSDSVSFRKARKACGKRLRRRHGYRFKRSGSDVILRRARRGRIANCGRKRHRHRRRDDPDRGQGRLSRQAEGEGVGRRPAGDQRRRAPGIREGGGPERGAVLVAQGGASGAGGRRALLRAGHERSGRLRRL